MNPLTAIYGGVTGVRNELFDRGVLRARRLEQPVVSVGNLSVGGAGKTPFVIALGELLKARGIRFDVLSRGYGRKTRGVLVVDPDGAASEFGDEPLLIARRLSIPVIVGESRYEAGRLGEQQFQPQLHILDDGFQHRSLARDFDIVLVTQTDFQDRLLPWGRLREPLSSLRRADAIALPQELDEHARHGLEVEVSGNPDGAGEVTAFPQFIWSTRRNIHVNDAPAAPVVFCGIARPQQFFAQLRAAGIAPAAEIAFRDHHPYKREDIERLRTARKKFGATGFLTTDKDAVNLGNLRAQLQPFVVAELEMTLEDPAGVLDAILTGITRIKPRS